MEGVHVKISFGLNHCKCIGHTSHKTMFKNDLLKLKGSNTKQNFIIIHKEFNISGT